MVFSWVEKLRSNNFELTEKSQTLCGFFSQSSKSHSCVCVHACTHMCVCTFVNIDCSILEGAWLHTLLNKRCQCALRSLSPGGACLHSLLKQRHQSALRRSLSLSLSLNLSLPAGAWLHSLLKQRYHVHPEGLCLSLHFIL